MSYLVEIRQNGMTYDTVDGLDKAIDLAEVFLGNVDESEPTTFSLHDESGVVVASLTNRRIMGTFIRQRWGGRDGMHAIEHDRVEFDATSAVLRLDHKGLLGLVDSDYCTDDIGTQSVNWNGPFEVEVVDSVLEFFGAESLQKISEAALNFAKTRLNPALPAEKELTVSVVLKLSVCDGASIDDFVRDFDWSFNSKTAGVKVVGSALSVTPT